jgi:methyltransferase (TIGR00027 family)
MSIELSSRIASEGSMNPDICASTSAQHSGETTAGLVAWTAHWTAAARARESQRSDRLFADPLAQALADETGLALLQDVKASSAGDGQATFIAIRTRFFDDFLIDTAHRESLRQVVILAAGMDTRAFRLPWPSSTSVYEIDQPDLLRLKDSTLAREHAKPRCQRYTVGADLEQQWDDELRSAGFQPGDPSLWLAEGFFYYLDESAVRTVLEQLTSLSGPNSWFGTDFLNHALIIHPWFKEMRDALASRGISWRFATDEPEALLAEYGWRAEVTQPGQEGANFGRWPYPVLDRHIKDCPRGLLVTAQRDSTVFP